MLCSVKFGLRLLLIFWCAKESIGSSIEESYDDEFNSLLLSGSNSSQKIDQIESKQLSSNCQELDLSARRDDFLRKLLMILTPSESQTEQLKTTIDMTFEDISNYIHNKTKANANAKSCGDQKECVEIWMCRNSTRNENGMYSIQFRNLFVKEQCNYNQICCHTADMIKKRPDPEIPVSMNHCGKRNVNGVELTLVGNEERYLEANFGEFPWMIALLEKESQGTADLLIYIGGGSLLAPNVVLTAAHKVANKLPSSLTVRAGEWDRTTTREIYDHQDIDVQQIIVHKQFQARNNNIALLVLKKSFNPSPHISPICLPSSNENFDHSRCIVTGWGKRAANSMEYPHILKNIVLPVLPRNECNDKLKVKMGLTFSLEQSSICAGGEKNVDSCFGDGGAPLVCPIKDMPNHYYQAGIVAWGIGCGMENVPAAYTNVPYFNHWITQELNKLNINSKYYTA